MPPKKIKLARQKKALANFSKARNLKNNVVQEDEKMPSVGEKQGADLPTSSSSTTQRPRRSLINRLHPSAPSPKPHKPHTFTPESREALSKAGKAGLEAKKAKKERICKGVLKMKEERSNSRR